MERQVKVVNFGMATEKRRKEGVYFGGHLLKIYLFVLPFHLRVWGMKLLEV